MKNRLKQLREGKGLTLDDVETMTGIKRGTFNNYENGTTDPKLATWIKLAGFFDVPVTYAMGLPFRQSIKKSPATAMVDEQNKILDWFNCTTFDQLKMSRLMVMNAIAHTRVDQVQALKRLYDYRWLMEKAIHIYRKLGVE